MVKIQNLRRDPPTAAEEAEYLSTPNALQTGFDPNVVRLISADAERAINAVTQHRQLLSSPLHRAFVRRGADGLGDELARAGIGLHDARGFRDHASAAAAARITGHWEALRLERDHSKVSHAFWHNPAAMVGEADRMLSVYGPALAQQPQFLTEYHTDLQLFHITGLTSASCQRADLLARIDLPIAFPNGFDGYDSINVKRIKEYNRSVLRTLEADYRRDRNPVYAWEAILVAWRYGINLPAWVLNYLAKSAENISVILKDVGAGKSVQREADRVGKALEFGTDGPGRGSRFKGASIWKRDRAIYLEVIAKQRDGHKLDFAYDFVARAHNTTRSTVVRAYLRLVKLNDQADQKDRDHSVS